MFRIGSVFVAIVLGACGIAAVSDRYGNRYGGWYDPGNNYRWQLDLCETQMEQRSVPPLARPLAMRCCMFGHGVPIDDPQDCRA